MTLYDGTLDVDHEPPAHTEFNNIYAAAGSLDLSGTKALTGRDLAAGEFECELKEGATVLQTVSNLARWQLQLCHDQLHTG